MKTEFGTPWSRLLHGGVVLSPLECWSLRTLVSSLPPELSQVVEAQFQRYVLVQREIDGRALNFYPRRSELKKGLRAPLLPMDKQAAPLVRVRFSVAKPPGTLHAVLHAVLGRVFCVSFSQDVRPFSAAADFAVEDIEHSWRSNFSLAKARHASSG